MHTRLTAVSFLFSTVMVLTLVAGFTGVRVETRGLASQDDRSTVWDGVYTVEQAQRGAVLYVEACAECHGPDLSGGEMAPGLAGGEFAWNWNGLSVGDLFERLRISMPQGVPGSVNRQDKADILAYMFEMNGFPAGESELATRTAPLAGIAFAAEPPRN